MHLEPWANFALVFFVVIFSLIAVGALAVMAFAVKKLEKLIETLTVKVEPVIVKASDTLDSVQRVTVNVGEKADHILSRGETLTDDVSTRVEKTAAVVQSAVTTPLINLSSLITGVSKGFSVWGHAVTQSGVSGNGTGGAKARVKRPE